MNWRGCAGQGNGWAATDGPHHGAGFTADKSAWYSMDPHDACVEALRDGVADRISTHRVVHRECTRWAPSEAARPSAPSSTRWGRSAGAADP